MITLLINSIAVGYGVYSLFNFNMPKSLRDGFYTIISCSRCIAFWVTLLVSQNLCMALLSSLVALLLSTFIVTRL